MPIATPIRWPMPVPALPLIEPAVLAFSRVHGPSGPSFANPSPPLGPQKLPSSVIPLQASPDCSIRHLSVACALLAAACLTEAINAATRSSPPQCFLNAMYHPPGRPAGCRRLAIVGQDSWRHQHAAAAFLALEEEEERRPPQHIRLDGTAHQQQVRKRAETSGRQLVTGQQASNRASRAFSAIRDQASSGGAELRDVRGCLVMLSICRRSVGGLISGGGVAEEQGQGCPRRSRADRSPQGSDLELFALTCLPRVYWLGGGPGAWGTRGNHRRWPSEGPSS